MRKLGFILGLFWLCVPIAARAATCDAGYYLKNGECTICSEHFVCPDGVNRLNCGSLQYTDGPGATECLDCPTDLDGHTDLFHHFWTYKTGTHGVHACRADWYLTWPSGGSGHFSCGYRNNGGYVGKSDCMVDVFFCPAGYVSPNQDSDSHDTFQRFWVGSYDEAIQEPCSPAGIGYYSGPDTARQDACPDGTSTHTDTAASVDECHPLCAGGVTKLHAGKYSFNIWKTKSTSPAINIRSPGGDVCYVDLVSGTGKLNIRVGGAVYHVVN